MRRAISLTSVALGLEEIDFNLPIETPERYDEHNLLYLRQFLNRRFEDFFRVYRMTREAFDVSFC